MRGSTRRNGRVILEPGSIPALAGWRVNSRTETRAVRLIPVHAAEPLCSWCRRVWVGFGSIPACAG